LNIATAFISAAGITLQHGLTTSRSALADTLNAAAGAASMTVGLLDSTKFKRSTLLTVRTAQSLGPGSSPTTGWTARPSRSTAGPFSDDGAEAD
jgi:hypothetical protein